MNTYTKLRDGWGVRSTTPVQAGQTVQVQTKAGAIKTETVSRVLWQGPDKFSGSTIYLLAIKPRVQQQRSNRDEGWRGNGCSECRRLGDWCNRCAFDEFDC